MNSNFKQDFTTVRLSVTVYVQRKAVELFIEATLEIENDRCEMISSGITQQSHHTERRDSEFRMICSRSTGESPHTFH